MASESWAAKIRKDREAVEAKAELEQRTRLENRRNYEAKSEDFWKRVAAAVKTGVALFNEEGGLEQKVQFEESRNYCGAVQGGVGALQISIDHGSQRVRVIDRFMRRDGGRDDNERSYEVVSSKAGDLVFQDENKSPEEFIEGRLTFFCKRISGLR